MNPKKRNVRSKSPVELFQEFDKSKLQRMSRTFGKSSLGNKELEMEKKFKAVRLNKYKPQKFNNNYYLLIISILAIILILVTVNALGLFQIDKQIIYCSNDLDNTIECQPCPFNTECENGRISQCPIGTFLQDNECIPTEKIDILKKQMKDTLIYKLKYLKGDSICQEDPNLAVMKISSIENYLQDQFKGEQFWEDALKEFIFDIRYDSKYQNIFQTQYDTSNNYDLLISTKEAKFRMGCAFKIFLQKHKWLIIFTLACIILLGLMYIRMVMNKKYVRLAEKIYKKYLKKFNEGLNEIDTSQISYADKDFLKPSERNKVMDILEDIRRKDEQLTVVEKHGALFWVKI